MEEKEEKRCGFTHPDTSAFQPVHLFQLTDESDDETNRPADDVPQSEEEQSAYMSALPAMLAEARREKASIMSPKDYIIPLITAYIPVVGMIFAFIGKKQENPNRRNFFKVSFWTNLVLTLLFLACIGVGWRAIAVLRSEPETAFVSEAETTATEEVAVTEETSQEAPAEEAAAPAEGETTSAEAESEATETASESSTEAAAEEAESEAASTESSDASASSAASETTSETATTEKTAAETESAEATAETAAAYSYNAENGALSVRINGALTAVPVSAEALSAWEHVDTTADESDATQERAFYYDSERSSITLIIDVETKAVKMAQLYFNGSTTEFAGLTKASTPQNAIDTFTTATSVDESALDEGRQNGSLVFHFGDSHAVTIMFSGGMATMVSVQ